MSGTSPTVCPRNVHCHVRPVHPSLIPRWTPQHRQEHVGLLLSSADSWGQSEGLWGGEQHHLPWGLRESLLGQDCSPLRGGQWPSSWFRRGTEKQPAPESRQCWGQTSVAPGPGHLGPAGGGGDESQARHRRQPKGRGSARACVCQSGGEQREEGARSSVTGGRQAGSSCREGRRAFQHGRGCRAGQGQASRRGTEDNSGLFYFLSYRDTQLKCKVLEKTLVLTAINFQIKYSHFEYA